MGRFYKILFLTSFLFLSGCMGVICKWKNKKIIIDYTPHLNTATVGGVSYTKHNPPWTITPWVKKIIIKHNGFLVVEEQKTAGSKKIPCAHDKNKMCDKHVINSVYTMQSYKEDEGYKYWPNIPKEKWAFISNLDDKISEKPEFHTKECESSFFAEIINNAISLIRAW